MVFLRTFLPVGLLFLSLTGSLAHATDWDRMSLEEQKQWLLKNQGEKDEQVKSLFRWSSKHPSFDRPLLEHALSLGGTFDLALDAWISRNHPLDSLLTRERMASAAASRPVFWARNHSEPAFSAKCLRSALREDTPFPLPFFYVLRSVGLRDSESFSLLKTASVSHPRLEVRAEALKIWARSQPNSQEVVGEIERFLDSGVEELIRGAVYASAFLESDKFDRFRDRVLPLIQTHPEWWHRNLPISRGIALPLLEKLGPLEMVQSGLPEEFKVQVRCDLLDRLNYSKPARRFLLLNANNLRVLVFLSSVQDARYGIPMPQISTLDLLEEVRSIDTVSAQLARQIGVKFLSRPRVKKNPNSDQKKLAEILGVPVGAISDLLIRKSQTIEELEQAMSQSECGDTASILEELVDLGTPLKGREELWPALIGFVSKCGEEGLDRTFTLVASRILKLKIVQPSPDLLNLTNALLKRTSDPNIRESVLDIQMRYFCTAFYAVEELNRRLATPSEFQPTLADQIIKVLDAGGDPEQIDWVPFSQTWGGLEWRAKSETLDKIAYCTRHRLAFQKYWLPHLPETISDRGNLKQSLAALKKEQKVKSSAKPAGIEASAPSIEFAEALEELKSLDAAVWSGAFQKLKKLVRGTKLQKTRLRSLILEHAVAETDLRRQKDLFEFLIDASTSKGSLDASQKRALDELISCKARLKQLAEEPPSSP